VASSTKTTLTSFEEQAKFDACTSALSSCTEVGQVELDIQEKSGNGEGTSKDVPETKTGQVADKGHGKQKKTQEEIPTDKQRNPDEPTYCLCKQFSHGKMIACDNNACSIEWFHFPCVGLKRKPRGKWYCPNCRGSKSNIIKPELK
jgi:hypothetical protein